MKNKIIILMICVGLISLASAGIVLEISKSKTLVFDEDKKIALNELSINDFQIEKCVKINDEYCKFQVYPNNPYINLDHKAETYIRYKGLTDEQLQIKIQERINEILNRIAEDKINYDNKVVETKEYLSDEISIKINSVEEVKKWNWID